MSLFALSLARDAAAERATALAQETETQKRQRELVAHLRGLLAGVRALPPSRRASDAEHALRALLFEHDPAAQAEIEAFRPGEDPL